MSQQFPIFSIQETPEELLRQTAQSGVILLPNCSFTTAQELQNYLNTFPIQLRSYQFGQSPRTKRSQWIYTTTEYPPRETIPPHHELSYTTQAPRFLFFYCQQPASIGGQTTLLDGQEFYRKIEHNSLFKSALEHGLHYHKTMPSSQNRTSQFGFGKSWQEHFETEDKTQVESYLKTTQAQWEWGKNNQLHTQTHRPLTHIHPQTKKKIWFAQPSLWHLSCFGKKGVFLMERLPKRQYPVHITLGNGEELSPKLLQEIQKIERELAIPYPWKKGDLLIVDNWRFAHGRLPFEGKRVHWIALGS